MLYIGAVLAGTGKQFYSRVAHGRRQFHLRAFDEIGQPYGLAQHLGSIGRHAWRPRQ